MFNLNSTYIAATTFSLLSAANLYAAPVQDGAQLAINEINVGGPGAFFVEIVNNSGQTQDLGSILIQSSQGVLSLSSAPPLAPGEYFIVNRGEGTGPYSNSSIDSPILGSLSPAGDSMSFSQPLMHVMKDTVVLRDGDMIIDAVSYGTSKDDSALYNEAVAAGEFAPGTFVDTSFSYSSVNLGRNGSSADTNLLSDDWALHGGADSFNISPGAANVKSFTSEKEVVRHFQTIMNQGLVNGLGINVTYADHSNFGGSFPLTTDHSFTTDSPEFGQHVLAGPSVDYFVPTVNGQYDIYSYGTFTDGSLMVTGLFIETVRTQFQSRYVSLVVTLANGDQYEYTEGEAFTYTGTWGDYVVDQTRTVTAWDGIERSTASNQKISWDPKMAEVTSMTTETAISRDYPANPPMITAYQAWVDNGSVGLSPNAPYTTEIINFVSSSSLNASGVVIDFDNYTIDHGAFGSAVQENCSITMTRTGFSSIEATNSYFFNGPVPTEVSQQVNVSIFFPSEDMSIQGVYSHDDVAVATFNQYIDPVRCASLRGEPGFWSWVGWGLATAVTGAACAVGTTITATATGLATVTTLGAATPGMVMGTGAVGGLCATASTAVGNGLWPGGN